MPRSKKPETQYALPTSVENHNFNNTESQGFEKPKINWSILINNPKFQMYAVEVSKNSYENVMEWISKFLADQLATRGENSVFDHYVEWHDQKGLWKNEDVFGVFIGD